MVPSQSLLPTIQINFVSSDGATTKQTFPVISKKSRKLDPLEWDEDEAKRRFLWYLSRSDIEGLDAATVALIRLDCLGPALKDCFKGKRPNVRKLEALLHLWNLRGLGSIPNALKENLCLFTDVIRYYAPPYTGQGLTLYRGQSRTRHEDGNYGIAWTSSYEIAKRFSMRKVSGAVVKIDASQDMILVHLPDFISTPMTEPSDKLSYEDEYILDPRRFANRVTIVR